MLKPARLKSVPVFAGLGKDELRRIAECAEEMQIDAGEHLLRETAYAFEFLVIEDGAAEVTRDGAHVAHLGPGDVMGELGLAYGDNPMKRDGGSWQYQYMFFLGLIIGGGTSQIQKNIISERGLGMPKEPKLAQAD